MPNFFGTLIRPDQEENAERAEVAKAANALQIGEFQLLQLAYHEWHGRELPPELNDDLFRAYMLYGRVPSWARHYARRILELDERGELDDLSPGYHRYDSEYYTPIPLGTRRFAVAVCCLALVLGGGLLIGHWTTAPGTSVLPPYFEDGQPARTGGDDLNQS